MKKSLALLAILALSIGSTGCGSCRGLFCKRDRAIAAPVISHCAPVCNPGCYQGSMCTTASDCGCECGSGTAVTYGYDGGSVPYESMPMTIPTGAFGQ